MPIRNITAHTRFQRDYTEENEKHLEKVRELGDKALIEGKYDEAIRIYEEGINSVPREGNAVILSIILSNIGSAYAKLGDYEKAEHYFRFARTMIDEIRNRRTQNPQQSPTPRTYKVLFILSFLCFFMLLATYYFSAYTQSQPNSLPYYALFVLVFLISAWVGIGFLAKSQRRR